MRFGYRRFHRTLLVQNILTGTIVVPCQIIIAFLNQLLGYPSQGTIVTEDAK